MSPHSRAVLATLLALALPLGVGCDGDGDESSDATTTTAGAGDGADTEDDPAVGERAADLVDTPFCQRLLDIDQIDSTAGEGAAAEVVAGAERVRGLLVQAQDAIPVDAPAEVQTFLADTKTSVDAIIAAGGDVNAAFAGLGTSDPGLVARLQEPGGYQAAVDYVDEHCGLDIGS